MNSEGLRRVAQALRLYNAHQVNNWIMVSCPMAPWTHTSMQDRHPSCGFRIRDTGFSTFHCFTCGHKGRMMKLSSLLEKLSGKSYSELGELIYSLEMQGFVLPDWENPLEEEDVLKELSSDYLDVYDHAVGHPYLKLRGISDDTAEKMQLRLDVDRQGAERILFPVMGTGKELYGFSGRAVLPNVDPKVRDYHGLKKRKVLLGAQFIPNFDYIVVVEGLVDAAVMIGNGFPAVAVMHSGLTEDQAAILIDQDKPVYLMFDNDSAGRKGALQACERLQHHIPVLRCIYPYDEMTDPAEISEKEARSMVHKARLWTIRTKESYGRIQS